MFAFQPENHLAQYGRFVIICDLRPEKQFSLHFQCELYHWADVLDICDEVLEQACRKKEGTWTLPCDLPQNVQVSPGQILDRSLRRVNRRQSP